MIGWSSTVRRIRRSRPLSILQIATAGSPCRNSSSPGARTRTVLPDSSEVGKGSGGRPTANAAAELRANSGHQQHQEQVAALVLVQLCRQRKLDPGEQQQPTQPASGIVFSIA